MERIIGHWGLVIGHSSQAPFSVGTDSLLRLRLLSAAVILGVLFALVWLDYERKYVGVEGVWLLPIFIGVSVLATEEVLSLFAAKGWRPAAWPLYVGNVLLALAACGPIWVRLLELDTSHGLPHELSQPLGQLGLVALVLALWSAVVFAVEMQKFQRPGTASLQLAMAIFTLLYIGVLYGFTAALRLFHDHEWGLLALLSLLAVVKMADTGAYFVGRLLGRHKMTPILSPKKTIEGAVGGIVAACISSWAVFYFVGPYLVRSRFVMPPTAGWLTYGLVIAVAGMIGDLAESLLKRDMERKDSSTWLPGLGGVLDIIDSELVATPFAYACWLLGIVGPGI
jgi:phosphatidate cytidylyltransferase